MPPKKILIAPLDWGLGHTIRCIPIIHILIKNNFTIFFAGNLQQQHIIKNTFPHISFIYLKGYNIKYSKFYFLLWLKIGLQIPKIFCSIWYEHRWLKNTQKKYEFEFIFSDNRYGLYNKHCKNFIITHQLTIQMPFNWLEFFVQKIHYYFIQKFNVCLIPDCENKFNNLAGKLSHPHFLPNISTKYLNILTRFFLPNISTNIKYEYCFLLSGTEPQRTILENIFINQIKHSTENIVFIRGVTNHSSLQNISNTITIYNFVDTNELLNIILQTKNIIARSGYTTVMELTALQKKVLYIPTPQQTEQMYLASYLEKNKLGICLKQNNFNFTIAKNKLNNFIPNFNKIQVLQEIDLLPLLK